VEDAAFVIRINKARATGLKLRSDKGVNLPDTKLSIPSLTAADREALKFVALHADAVEFSFVRTPEDLRDLREAITHAAEERGERLGVVLKIETAAGFANLPELLLAALSWPAAGVMIARGDLAVEVGYQRMAEVQEEILWLCEAAHVPVIWATQVLETLAKKGIPSRSEITDAAMGERAECVMLNKGPYVLDAVRMLDDILRRMAGHQVKKRPMLRPLKVARGFGGERPHTERA
jgi:pyruvate kinase